ncbi:MAG TPA: OsmC family protein [Sphingomicrobium sp.]|nr:OsmC family protein [Sphingomicrobium sp.]
MLSPLQKNIVNDVDLDRLQQLVADAQANPALGFEVTTRWDGQFRSESRVGAIRLGNGDRIVRDHVIRADEPEEILGNNEAPNPQELLMAALNACMTVGYVAGAATRGITLTKLEIETKGTLDLRGFFALADNVPPGYPSLNYVVRIAGDGTPEQFAEIHAEVQATSPNYDNLARAIRMDATLEVEAS